MDTDHAQELLARERTRIERGLAGANREGPLESSENLEPGDEDSEDLYEDELDESRREQLTRDLAALERAEARLADGSYGLSVESGEPISDARLEALPLVERTVDEEERFRR